MNLISDLGNAAYGLRQSSPSIASSPSSLLDYEAQNLRGRPWLTPSCHSRGSSALSDPVGHRMEPPQGCRVWCTPRTGSSRYRGAHGCLDTGPYRVSETEQCKTQRSAHCSADPTPTPWGPQPLGPRHGGRHQWHTNSVHTNRAAHCNE